MKFIFTQNPSLQDINRIDDFIMHNSIFLAAAVAGIKMGLYEFSEQRREQEILEIKSLSSLCEGIDSIEHDQGLIAKDFANQKRRVYREKLEDFDKEYGHLELPERAELYTLHR